MLHAIAQGKSKIYRRYIGQKDEKDEQRVTAEDEITALILGPLKFLTPAERAGFWYHLLVRLGAKELPNQQPTDAQMILWKRFHGLNRRVEPDLMVYLTYPNGQQIAVIVELKWRSPLSGRDQLHRQWAHCLSSDEQESGFHLFIGLETSAASAAVASEYSNPWRGRLLIADWASIKQMLHSGVFTTTEGRDWAESTCIVLNKLGIRAFAGFLSLPSVSIPNLSGQSVFWQGLIGWNHLKFQDIPADQSPVFFSSP